MHSQDHVDSECIRCVGGPKGAEFIGNKHTDTQLHYD